MPVERSAGAIVFRRDKEIKYLLLHYGAAGFRSLHSKGDYWSFPKGNVEEGESEEETARREIKEESGIEDIKFVDGFKEKISYFYKREGKTIYKEVVFFLAETKSEKVKISYEHIGFEWLGFEDAFTRLKFKNDREVFEKAHRFLVKR